MFLVRSLKQFTDAFKDPYYVDVIEPDEREMIDKDGPGSGVIASFQGLMIDIVHQGKNTLGEHGHSYRKTFEEHERSTSM